MKNIAIAEVNGHLYIKGYEAKDIAKANGGKYNGLTKMWTVPTEGITTTREQLATLENVQLCEAPAHKDGYAATLLLSETRTEAAYYNITSDNSEEANQAARILEAQYDAATQILLYAMKKNHISTEIDRAQYASEIEEINNQIAGA